MIEIIYRVNIGKYDKYKEVCVWSTDGKYKVVEGIHYSYSDQFTRPYTDFDYTTLRTFDSALEADDYSRKIFFELQKKCNAVKSVEEGEVKR